MRKGKIRYAVVGLGYIGQVAMLPAFAGARRNSRLAALVSGEREKLELQVWGTKGSLKLEQAFEMIGEKRLIIEGGGAAKPERRRFGNRDQFAPLLIEFSDAIKAGRDPFPNGAEGVAHIRAIEAIYRSIASGAPARVENGGGKTGDDLVRRRGNSVKPHPKPDLVNAEGPSA